ncbi:hypothetical protein Lal_00016303 [Lupinus albus]|uniref:Putative bromodomain-containing protein n=1 Tax=Lupinus albus TaxID=3870 RepID=A0A6A4QHA2_LUPAL|nr:putative bromodomain-containing protein [Lupinus albus]KAF1873167.1 hypothetical protein Lal_00016303 [Lupinus albus]
MVMVRWSSWSELLLGGAVVRHGTQDWPVIAAELRTRTVSPDTFTPEVCKAKYQELLKRYSGSKVWFEELKKEGIAELKRALEQSEKSIGFLKSKLEFLKTEKNEKKSDCHVDDVPAGQELHVPSQNLERVESSNKETSKDGLSAGSFTHETRTNWSPEASRSAEQEKVLNVHKLEDPISEGQAGGLKKQRGKRKRKDSDLNINKTNVRESDVLRSVDVSGYKESSTSNSHEIANFSGKDKNNNLRKDRMKDVMEILDYILQSKGASSFHHKHDSQKRGRYRSMIRQHMDLDTIRSRISNRTIKSVMELFRDLYLLINNALVFYSKSTRQYKNAQLLRDTVKETLKECIKDFRSSVTNADVSITLPVDEPPLKLRSVCPGNRKVVAKEAGGGSKSASEVSQGAKVPNKVNPPLSEESLPIKKSFGRSKKVGRETTGSQRTATPMKRRRTVRTKDDKAEDLVPTQV